MADCRKRRGSSGLSLSHRLRQRRRRSDAKRMNIARNIVTAITAAVVVVVAVATATAHTIHSPQIRKPVWTPRRLDWQEHAEDLDERDAWKTNYRMTKAAFYKLAAALAPRLTRDAYMARMRTPNGVIPVQVRLAIALRILAGGLFVDVSQYYGVAQATIYLILWEVVDAINATPEVGPFFFPQTEAHCKQAADRWKVLSTNGVFDGVVAAADGLFIKCWAPTAKETANVISYYSGSKSSYGVNVQATCDYKYRFCSMSAISPGATNDWVAWNRSSLAAAVRSLPFGYYIIGDAAYPISDQVLTPYPGRGLARGHDSFNFHLSQLRVKIEQSFGMLVSQWGILWRPLRVQFAGRPDLIKAIFHLHNYLQDEKVKGVRPSEETEASGRGRPVLTTRRTLPPGWQTEGPAPSRSGEAPARATLRLILEDNNQWRPEYNKTRNASS